MTFSSEVEQASNLVNRVVVEGGGLIDGKRARLRVACLVARVNGDGIDACHGIAPLGSRPEEYRLARHQRMRRMCCGHENETAGRDCNT